MILGFWKVFGAGVLFAPGMPRLKEWAYAGVFPRGFDRASWLPTVCAHDEWARHERGPSPYQIRHATGERDEYSKHCGHAGRWWPRVRRAGVKSAFAVLIRRPQRMSANAMIPVGADEYATMLIVVS